MKLFFGIISLIFSGFIGYLLSLKYKYRREFYEDFKQFNGVLLGEVNFTGKTIKNIVKSLNKKSAFYQLLRKRYLNTNEKIYDGFLKQEDKDFLFEYFDLIGTSDKDSQIELLKKKGIELTDKVKAVTEEDKKYKSLYLKLGFFIGLIIFIILL